MNAGPTEERVHAALKREILGRAYRPGDRLDVGVIAEAMASSATPVREALHQLVGEGLVTARTGGGFFVPAWDEPGLRDLYAWCGEVLALACRRPAIGSAADAPQTAAGSAAETTSVLFLAIACRSANSELARTVALLNDRLHAARLAEPAVLDGIEAELGAIADAHVGNDTRALRRLLATYHRRRMRAAAGVVRGLYRGGDGAPPTFGI